MKKLKVLLEFTKLSVPEKIIFYRNVISKMTGNINFPDPEPKLTVATTKVDKLETDEVAALGGDHTKKAIMDQTEKETDQLFRDLAMYVDKTAKGDEAIILSSGFMHSRQPTARHKPPFSVRVSENSNELIMYCSRIKGAKSFVWQYALDLLPANNAGWILADSNTQNEFILKGLKSGDKCWCRVAIVTPAGMQPFSDPIMKIVP